MLLELGYAAKVLGWDRIICIFNTDYGDFDDLPFDLRFRRPLCYSLKGKEKSETKKIIVKIITQTIKGLYIKGLLGDDFNDYFKMQVDTQVLSIINHLIKIVYGYETRLDELESYRTFINLKREEILSLLSRRKYIGFQVNKKFEPIGKELRILLDSFTSPYFNKEIGIVIVTFINWINRFDKFTSLRQSPDLFICSDEKVIGYIAVYGPDINPNNKDGYLLLKELDDNNGQVIDFGEFQEKQKIDSMLNYLYLNEKYNDIYADLIFEFLDLVGKWGDYTNGKLIIDNLNHFEINNTVIPPQKIRKAISKTASIEEDILLLLHENFNFDYINLVRTNALIHFFRQGFIIDNHLKMMGSIQRYLMGKTKLNSDFSILPLDDEFEIKRGLSEKERLEGLEKLDRIRLGFFDVDYIYITHKYGNLIETLLRLSENRSLRDNTRELLLKIIKDSQDNVINHLIEPLKMFVVESAKVNNETTLNLNKTLDEFNKTRNYHEKDINLFVSDVRHLIVKK